MVGLIVPASLVAGGYAGASRAGVRILAPPIYVLLDVGDGEIVPLAYARQARQVGIDLITRRWSAPDR